MRTGESRPVAAWPSRGALLIVAVLFTAIALYGSLVPLQYRALDWEAAWERFRRIPFLQLSMGSRADWVANILLFLPLGYFWVGAASLQRSRLAAAAWSMALVPALAALSVAIEFAQLWFPPRTVSQNDIVAETLGALLGVVAWLLFGEATVAWVQRYSADRRPASQIEWLLQAYLVGFVLYSVLPLDLTISLAELFQKLREGKIQVVPFVYSYDSLGTAAIHMGRDVLLALPIGALAAITWLKPDAVLRPFAKAWLVGVGAVAAIELAQIFVYSRVADTTDILLGGVGVAIGAGSAGFVCRRSQAASVPVAGESSPRYLGAWSLAGVVYAAAILAAAWAPYDFTHDEEIMARRLHGLIERVPGASLYAGTEFNALAQVLKRLLTYAPLGAIAALWAAALARSTTGRRLAMLVGLGCISTIAAASEVGQVFLVSRTADLTEVPICLLGAVIGLGVTCRLRSAIGLQNVAVSP